MYRILALVFAWILAGPALAESLQDTPKATDKKVASASPRCGGEVVSTTPWFDAQLSAFEITPFSPMECLEDSVSQETVMGSDGSRSERTIRKKVTKRAWEYIDHEGKLRALDTTCTFVCSGLACSNGGCEADAKGCSDFYCNSPVASNNCSGTCTKTSSNRPHPNNKN